MLFDGLLMLDPCVYFAISFLSARVRSLGKIYATFSRVREFALHFPTNLVCTKKGRPRGGGGGGGYSWEFLMEVCRPIL